mgnify:CR=1 FL=1
MKAARPHPLRNANPFKLGLFSVNADGGLAFTTVENRWQADWDDIATMARMADEAGIEFFEKKIRPVLVERCHECHAATGKVKAGLRLDHAEGWLRGGDSGPAVIPGKPDESPLIKAIRYTKLEFEAMPPKSALPKEEVALLEDWVRRGAPAPAEAAPVAEDPVVEQRLIAIAAELRCLVCQNESLAGSRADLALDLRREIRGMIARGDSDDAIRTFLTERYGEFILYRPRFTTTTLLLWTGPALLLVIGLVILARQLRRRTRTAIPAEEADLSDEERARLAAALADSPDTPTSGRRES